MQYFISVFSRGYTKKTKRCTRSFSRLEIQTRKRVGLYKTVGIVICCSIDFEYRNTLQFIVLFLVP